MEKRLLLAFVLSAAILLAWSVIFPPPQRPVPTPEPGAEPQAPVEQPTAPAEAADDADAGHDEEDVEPVVSAEAMVAATEESVALSNAVMEIELTNRGAAIAGYRLLAYDGDDGRPLDLVQTEPLDEGC